LVEIWQTLHRDKDGLKQQYAERHALIARFGKKSAYERVLARYNARPNGADLLFHSRASYGRVVRVRQNDGIMSTPVGAHDPVPPESFGK
jgi:DNA adenine methylase